MDARDPKQYSCLSDRPELVARLQDLTPLELGTAMAEIRSYLGSLDFKEVVLSPFDRYPIDFSGDQLDVMGVGQLRFNTEPEIWDSARFANRFFSISNLFRNERIVNPLRKRAFWVVDFYDIAPPESLLPIFRGILDRLASIGTAALRQLPIRDGMYDPTTDGPVNDSDETRWVITKGYDAAHSFFEIDETGVSTRREIFLCTPSGYLEVGVFGITGWNHNPAYSVRNHLDASIVPDLQRSGLCLGIERLLMAERVLTTLGGGA